MLQVDLTQFVVAPSWDWNDGFEAWLKESGRRENTVSAYLQDMRHYFRFFNDLTAGNVKSYFAMQDQDNQVKPTSRNRRLASMRVFVKWAVEMGLMDSDPTIGVKRVEVEMSPRDRTADEMAILEKVVTDQSHLRCHTDAHSFLGRRDELIWGLFNDAGLRIHEVAGLKIGDVDLVAREIRVLGKGGKKAPVAIPQRLVDLITSWLEIMPASVGGYLVTDWKGQGITRGQVWRRIKLIGDKAGLQLRPHDLRHTFVYSTIDTALRQGIDLPVAFDVGRKQARHGDVRTTTKFYLRARGSQVRSVVEAR